MEKRAAVCQVHKKYVNYFVDIRYITTWLAPCKGKVRTANSYGNNIGTFSQKETSYRRFQEGFPVKITKDTLEQLIKEELAIVLAEQDGGFRPQPGERPGGGIDRKPAQDESELAAFKSLAHLDRRGGSLVLEIARKAIMHLDDLSDTMQEATDGAVDLEGVSGSNRMIDPKTTQLASGSDTPFKLADMRVLEEYAAVIDTARAKIRELVKKVEEVTPRGRLHSKYYSK